MFIGAWVILLSHGMVQAEVPIARIYDEHARSCHLWSSSWSGRDRAVH